MYSKHPVNKCHTRVTDYPMDRVTQIPETFSPSKSFIPSSSHQLFTKLDLIISTENSFIFPLIL